MILDLTILIKYKHLILFSLSTVLDLIAQRLLLILHRQQYYVSFHQEDRWGKVLTLESDSTKI